MPTCWSMLENPKEQTSWPKIIRSWRLSQRISNFTLKEKRITETRLKTTEAHTSQTSCIWWVRLPFKPTNGMDYWLQKDGSNRVCQMDTTLRQIKTHITSFTFTIMSRWMNSLLWSNKGSLNKKMRSNLRTFGSTESVMQTGATERMGFPSKWTNCHMIWKETLIILCSQESQTDLSKNGTKKIQKRNGANS